MSTKTLSRLALGLLLAVVAAIATPHAWAVGTPAGTDITNQATVDFADVNGNPLQVLSNVVTTTVSAVEGVDITPAAGQDADPGDLVCYLHTVTNTGNDTDSIDVSTASSMGWTVNVYEDTDSSGDYSVGDAALVDNNGNGSVDTGDLANDAATTILVCVSVPTDAADAAVDNTTVTVASYNDPGVTDAVTDTTTIQAPTLSVVKSVDPPGDQPPGTTLTYTIEVTNTGTGVAQNVVLTDPIPTYTTYVGGSASTDIGAITATDPVTATIGTLNPGEMATVTFQVTID